MHSTTPIKDYKDVKLEDLPDAEFRRLVDREIRKDHPNTPRNEQARLNALSPKLRHPAVIGRWIMVLETMKASAETQLGAKLAELKKDHGKITEEEYKERRSQYLQWKAGNVRFLNSVQQRLLDARYARNKLFGSELPTRLVRERNSATESLVKIVEAVQSHRSVTLAEYDPTEADEDLWAVIQQATKEQQ